MAWDIDELGAAIGEAYKRRGLEGESAAEDPSVRRAVSGFSDALRGKYPEATALDVGGSGVTLRLKTGALPDLDAVLKFPRPVQGKVQFLAQMLEREAALLARLRHPGLAALRDYGHLEMEYAGEKQVPYVVMDFVSGARSAEWAARPDTTEEAFVRFLYILSQTVAFLHREPGREYIHMDLKADNVLVNERGEPVIIDLGTCKHRGTDAGLTQIATTLSHAAPTLAGHVSRDPTDRNRARGEVERGDLDAAWDLWAFGQTVLELLGLSATNPAGPPAPSLYARLSPYARKFVVLLAARLQAGDPTGGPPQWLTSKCGLPPALLKKVPVRSASDLAEALGRLTGEHSPLDRVAELRQNPAESIQIAPGAQAPLTDAVRAVLAHPLYRRLGAITQLGLVSQVYPNARHTRRAHSLGTYANVAAMLRALYSDPHSPLFRQLVGEDDCRAVLLLALVHDLGQYPLAHDLEPFVGGELSHEKLTSAVLRGEWNIKEAGARRVPFDPVTDLLRTWKVPLTRLELIMEATPSSTTAAPMDKLLRSLLNCPIDADKLDYLCRDARMTDVPYPLGIDRPMLLRCLTVTVAPKIGTAEAVLTLAVHAKGRVAAEAMAFARYAMFCQVYWHHAVRAQAAMLARAVGDLFSRLDKREQRLLQTEFLLWVRDLPGSLYGGRPEEQRPLPIEQGDEPPGAEPEKRVSARPTYDLTHTDLMPTDAAVLAWLQWQLARNSSPAFELVTGILNRSFFKRLWVVARPSGSVWENIVKAWDALAAPDRMAVARTLEEKILDVVKARPPGDVTAMTGQEAIERLEARTKAQRPWLLVDVPDDRPGSQVPLYYVPEGLRRQLRKDDRAVGDPEASDLWQALGRDLRASAGKVRVFCHPELAEAVEAAVPWERGVEILLEVVTEGQGRAEDVPRRTRGAGGRTQRGRRA